LSLRWYPLKKYTFALYLPLNEDAYGNQTIQGPNEGFSAASKGFKTTPDDEEGPPSGHDWKKDLFILMNEFEQETHECSSQNREG